MSKKKQKNEEDNAYKEHFEYVKREMNAEDPDNPPTDSEVEDAIAQQDYDDDQWANGEFDD